MPSEFFNKCLEDSQASVEVIFHYCALNLL